MCASVEEGKTKKKRIKINERWEMKEEERKEIYVA